MLLLYQENTSCLRDPGSHFFFKGTAFSTSYKVFVDPFTQSLIPNLTRITVFLPCHGQAHCPLIDMSPFCRLPLKSSGIFQINLRKCWFKFPKNSFLIIKHLNLCHLFVRLIKKPQKKRHVWFLYICIHEWQHRVSQCKITHAAHS